METHNNSQALKLLKRKMSDPDIHHPVPDAHPQPVVAPRSAAISIPYRTDDVGRGDSDAEPQGIPSLNHFFSFFILRLS